MSFHQEQQDKVSNVPIQFSFGPVQHLHTVLIWKAPVYTGLLGLARVTRGVVYTHPAHLQSGQVVWEEGKGDIFCSVGANLALRRESAFPNRACKISCVMRVSVWRLRHAVCQLETLDSTNVTDVWMKAMKVFKNELKRGTSFLCAQLPATVI